MLAPAAVFLKWLCENTFMRSYYFQHLFVSNMSFISHEVCYEDIKNLPNLKCI